MQDRSPRFSLKLQIVYDDGNAFMSGPVVDMSETGVFIETVMPLEPGTEVRHRPLENRPPAFVADGYGRRDVGTAAERIAEPEGVEHGQPVRMEEDAPACDGRAVEALQQRGFDDVTIAQARLMMGVDPEGTRLSVLAARAQIAKQTATALVDKLERGPTRSASRSKSLPRRQRCPSLMS